MNRKMVAKELVKIAKKLMASSRTDFMMHYTSELKEAVKQLKQMNAIAKKHGNEDLPDDIVKRLEKAMSKYDTNVDETIQHWVWSNIIGIDEIVDLGMSNQNRWGTEPQMIIFAINEFYNILKTWN